MKNIYRIETGPQKVGSSLVAANNIQEAIEIFKNKFFPSTKMWDISKIEFIGECTYTVND